ncbi:MAG: iron-regulated protein [Bacteroidetes bacterium]|nr:iron-regulated protein [Bacteroidota bacterium]
MRQLILTISILFSVLTGYSQDKPAYVIYNSKGRKVSYGQMLKSFKKADVVLFGEFHDNPISHWLEFELTKDMNKLYDLTLGAEMIEADNQKELDSFLTQKTDEKHFDTTARLWPNYKTDYKPLVDFARDSGLTFVATNVPRRYARSVSKGGFEALDTISAQEREWIAPMPIAFQADLPTYVNMLKMMGDHGTPNVVKAQALKDATMAHFIMKYVPPRKGMFKKSTKKFLHFNGAYHSDHHEGIGWYISQISKKVRVMTITTVYASDLSKLSAEEKGKADFIIVVDEDMTRTY